MSVWDMLTFGSGIVGCATAVSVVRNTGSLGHLTGWVVGLLVGTCCFFGIRVVGKCVMQHLHLEKQQPPTFKMKATLRLLYFSAFAWIIVSGFLGFWITKLVVFLIAKV